LGRRGGRKDKRKGEIAGWKEAILAGTNRREGKSEGGGDKNSEDSYEGEVTVILRGSLHGSIHILRSGGRASSVLQTS